MASCPIDEEYGYDESRFESNVDENFHCSICYNVLKEPRMCKNNEHVFCLDCISQHLNVNSQSCPECNENLTMNTLRRPRVLNNYLSKLKINCDYASRGCPEFTCVEDLKTHVANCGFAPVTCSNENCGMVVNKQERAHHEYEICKYRNVSCHDCRKLCEVWGRFEDDIRKSKELKVEDLEGNITEVKKELTCVKNDLSKLQTDMAELKCIMNQMLEKLNKFELSNTLSTSSNQADLKKNTGKLPIDAQNKDLQNKSSGASQKSRPRFVIRRPPRLISQGFLQTNAEKKAADVKTPEVISLRDQGLNPSVLAQASPADQKQMLGERLFPIIQEIHPDLAGKITGMLLELDNAKLLHMLEYRDALSAQVEEAVKVLQANKC